MKKNLLVFVLVGIVSALVMSCGKPSDRAADSQLTAKELSRLMGFHVWKMNIPVSQQKFENFRIVLIKPDGTVIKEFGSGHGTITNSPACSCLLLGFRVERGLFSGAVEEQTTDGSAWTWNLNFTESQADSVHYWVTGDPLWKNGRATLAAFHKVGDPNGTNEADDSILAVELVP